MTCHLLLCRKCHPIESFKLQLLAQLTPGKHFWISTYSVLNAISFSQVDCTTLDFFSSELAMSFVKQTRTKTILTNVDGNGTVCHNITFTPHRIFIHIGLASKYILNVQHIYFDLTTKHLWDSTRNRKELIVRQTWWRFVAENALYSMQWNW